jgi:hypothetical protein
VTSKNTADKQPDRFCEFCEEKIPRNLDNWWRRIACEKEKCQKKKKEKFRRREKEYTRLTIDKKPYNKSPKIIDRLNGRKCVKCGKKLRGAFKYRCPTCFKAVSNAFFDFDDMKPSRGSFRQASSDY